MKKCESCSSPITWKEKTKSLLLGNRPITCPKCNSKYVIKPSSRLIVSLTLAIPLVIFGLFIAPMIGLSNLVMVGYLVVIALFISMGQAFFVKYDKKNTQKIKQ
ncbi:TIGR04104 family putative zinc finger protein [Bacillus sp. FJAT-45350]|uniref:TIGR04104 family putative zinc finger protein n=1 Tax=Bacillus sp. FJAT-45350 TaxID=2011014 RepID=UPI000BB74CFA|nr:TIGR04104 family putative zinc finger protein [Bacillus sp. FJAT-45350]